MGTISAFIFAAILSLVGCVQNVAALTMPGSEVNYTGASATNPFVANEPYVVNIQGNMITVPLYGASRTHDFSGSTPFVNPVTGRANMNQMQAYDATFADSFTPKLSGDYNLNDDQITNAGFPGRIEKRTLDGGVTQKTMVRYKADVPITIGKCRSQLNAFAVPPRTHVRWELKVQFGDADGGFNDWTLTPTGSSPVLFWQLHSMNQDNPPLAAEVDTDSSDPTKLMIAFKQRVEGATSPREIARVTGINRNTQIPITIEAFLDERTNAQGGKGVLQITVNNVLILEKSGAVLAVGSQPHWWAMDMYLWAEPAPYKYTRSSFWETAKFFVYPVSPTDTVAPSAPTGLASTAFLTWTESTDNVGIVGYKIYRNGVQIGTSNTTSFTVYSSSAGTLNNYTVRAYDAAGNVSADSNAIAL